MTYNRVKLKACWVSLFLLVIAISFPMMNYEDAFADTILLEDNFNDNSFDEVKWTVVVDNFDEINNHLEFSNAGNSFLYSNPVATSGKVTAQAFISVDISTTDELRFLLRDFDGTGDFMQFALIQNEFEIRTSGGYVFPTGISGGKDVKMEYDFDTLEQKWYYWDGVSWVQLDTTQIAPNAYIDARFILLYLLTDENSNGVVDDAFLTNAFYTTHFPEIAIPPTPASPPRTGGGGTTYADILESRAKQAVQDEISPVQTTEQTPLESLTQTLNTNLQLQSFLPNQNLGITLPFAPTVLNLVISIGAITAIGFVLLKAMRKI